MQSVLFSFALGSEPVSSTPYGNGHINDTQLVACRDGSRYVLQQINTSVFHEPVPLMRNIELVTAHLRKKYPTPVRFSPLCRPSTASPMSSTTEHTGAFTSWCQTASCYDQASEALFYECAVAFGRFQNHLSDFPPGSLPKPFRIFTIRPRDFRHYGAQSRRTPSASAATLTREIDVALAYEDFSHTLVDLQARGELPLRVTHNDTKINNVLFDAQTDKALCVIDLDTVMPGLSSTISATRSVSARPPQTRTSATWTACISA
jgi:aminoglycoside phosphotransferase (APT) family kinase protein